MTDSCEYPQAPGEPLRREVTTTTHAPAPLAPRRSFRRRDCMAVLATAGATVACSTGRPHADARLGVEQQAIERMFDRYAEAFQQLDAGFALDDIIRAATNATRAIVDAARTR